MTFMNQNQTWVKKSADQSQNKAPPPPPQKLQNNTPSFRYLRKDQLGGVIFCCKRDTVDECLKKQLFGLPALHFIYVQNIVPGLPLFLFNYSERKLYGIFEAASPGQNNIDPYGWTNGGSQRTSFPAQVQIRVRLRCESLTEKQFGPIIKKNYYSDVHFRFELDHIQANKFVSLFSSRVLPPEVPFLGKVRRQLSTQPPSPHTWNRAEGHLLSGGSAESSHHYQPNGNPDYSHSSEVTVDGNANGMDKDLILAKLKKLAAARSSSSSTTLENLKTTVDENLPELDNFQQSEQVQRENGTLTSSLPSNPPPDMTKLMEEVEKLKALGKEQALTIHQLNHRLMESETEIRQLKERFTSVESVCRLSEACIDSKPHLDPDDTIYLLGGNGGESWLASLDSYSPSRDVLRSLQPMNSVRAHASVATLNGALYVVGGSSGESDTNYWLNTVESYDPANDKWSSHPPLKQQKGNLATVTLNNNIFAIGGGNSAECFSGVEMFDPDAGRFISWRSMLQKRSALSAAVLNNAIYAVGGYDGKEYLSSVERFDPREHSWSKVGSMNWARVYHSVVVYQQKLFAMGGCDGSLIVPTVEVFDPRRGTWVVEDSMKQARAYSSAAVLRDTIYMIGGVLSNAEISETIEYYKDGQGWQETSLGAVGKRAYAAAAVL